jgi:hypothetical protein
MKKQLLLSATFVVLIFVFNSCKKNKTDKATDYSLLFNNTVWTGDDQYLNVAHPYGMQFKSDGTAIFINADGESPGTYTIDASSKKINIDIGFAKVSATIGNNELTGFTATSITNPGFSFVSCKLNTTWDQNLDGTNWSFTDSYGDKYPCTFAGSIINILSFSGTYTRKAGTIRFTLVHFFPDTLIVSFFGVIESSNIRGEYKYLLSYGGWQATKQ